MEDTGIRYERIAKPLDTLIIDVSYCHAHPEPDVLRLTSLAPKILPPEGPLTRLTCLIMFMPIVNSCRRSASIFVYTNPYIHRRRAVVPIPARARQTRILHEETKVRTLLTTPRAI